LTVYYGPQRGLAYEEKYPLNDVNIKLAIRFTAIKGKTVSKVYLYCEEISNPPIYRMGLQGEVDGKPSGVWLGYGDFTPVSGYNTVNLNVNVNLEESKHYYLVVEYLSGIIDATHYARPHVDTMTPHYLYPETFRDDDYRLLWSTDGGVTWTSLDYDACWIIEFTDGTGYGQPYQENWKTGIYGDNWAAELIKPEARKLLSSVEVNILKVGNPPDLDVIVYNLTDGKVEASVTIPSGNVGSTQTWVKAAFQSPITLLSTKNYRLYLKTGGGDESNSYAFGYDDAYGAPINITWGKENSYGQTSADGGATWSDHLYKDYLFRFTLEFNPALKTAPNSGL
jgi:acylphosphatase